MMQKLHIPFIFVLMFFFLVISQQLTAASARVLSVRNGDEGEVEKLDGVGDEGSFPDLMGLEACENGGKDCFDTRILAEAHLDYIYTQHHKP